MKEANPKDSAHDLDDACSSAAEMQTEPTEGTQQVRQHVWKEKQFKFPVESTRLGEGCIGQRTHL